jgi:hypothetical protein
MMWALLEALGIVLSVGIGAAVGWSMSESKHRKHVCPAVPSYVIDLEWANKSLLVSESMLNDIRERFNAAPRVGYRVDWSPYEPRFNINDLNINDLGCNDA